MQKHRQYGRASVLLSGRHSKALELATACKPSLEKFVAFQFEAVDIDIAVDGFMRDLRFAASTRRSETIKEFLKNSTGIDHSEFIKLPTSEHLDVWHSISTLNLGADLLFAYVWHEPIIIRLDRWGETHWEQHYGIIGDGAEVAREMLCLQPWLPAVSHEHMENQRVNIERVPLNECVFRIHEAHYAAHKANPSSVGSLLSMDVLGQEFRAPIDAPFLNGVVEMIKHKHQVPAELSNLKYPPVTQFQSQ